MIPFWLKIIKIINAFLIVVSFSTLISWLIYKRKKIIHFFTKIPRWFLGLNIAVLLYKFFLIPHHFTSRYDFGIWIMHFVKEFSWKGVLTHFRAPSQFALLKFFSSLLGGIGYSFTVNLHIIFAFLNALFIYWIVRFLFKDKLMAIVSSLLYSFSFITFIFSFTADYSNPALFFSIQALFFGALAYHKKNQVFLIPAIAATILAIGARPEYIIFGVIFLIFLSFFSKNKKIILPLYVTLLLPKVIYAIHTYLVKTATDLRIHQQTHLNPNLFQRAINVFIGHYQIFIINAKKSFTPLFNFFTLTGLFTTLAFIGLIFIIVQLIKKESAFKKNKEIFFFFLYFLCIFLYYAYFHKEGFHSNYKYIISLIFPLVVLASFAFKKIEKYLPITPILMGGVFSYFCIVCLLVNTRGVNMEINKNKYLHFYNDVKPILKKEYNLYNSLSYDNLFYNLFNKKKPDIEINQDTVFISNSQRTMLYSMPIQTPNAYPILPNEKLISQNIKDIAKKISPENTVYVSQGVFPFQSFYNIRNVNSKKFEHSILNNFSIEEKIISYYFKGHHIFLYKMKKRYSSD